MANLRDTVAYICKSYPYKSELSKSRLTKLVYLADWKMSIDHGTQITPIEWYFNHYGPYVPDVGEVARNDPAFVVEQTYNYFGHPKELVRLAQELEPDLSNEEKTAIDFAIEGTKSLSWDAFIKLVYSTYPIITKSRYEHLDLPLLAGQYKKSSELAAN